MTMSYSKDCKWPTSSPVEEKGVLVAADITQEWLLPWWWERYQRYNTHPVAFVDLGLSIEMKQWCKERGHYIFLPIADIFVQEKNDFSSAHIQKWEHQHGDHFWDSRSAWFKKPLACLRTPFATTIWMDLDCEIKGSLSPMFALSIPPEGIAIAKGYSYITGGKDVNSGVIVFTKGVAILEEWALRSLLHNDQYVGDQDILYELLVEKNTPINDLPLIYNWSRFSEPNTDAIVVHWHGKHGKSYITHQIQKAQIESLN